MLVDTGRAQINLMDELNAITKENTLKKKLQKDIRLSYMSSFNENRKIERLKVFQQIQVYIKRQEIIELRNYIKKYSLKDDTLFKNKDLKIKYKKTKLPPRGQLENSKDRMGFLNHLITSQSNGYNPVKNFLQKFRMQSKVIQERRQRERQQRLKYLKNKELKREKSKLLDTADRLTKAKLIREKAKRERELRNKNRKIEKKKTSHEINIEQVLEPINKNSTSQESRLENIALKDGLLNTNRDFLEAGFYEMPEYDKALIFKFKLGFKTMIKEKVIDLVDHSGDLLLHINIRNNNLIILNTQINNTWGKELKIKNTITNDENEFKILVKEEYFKILMNEKIISFFVKRKKADVKYLNINDNIKKFVFKTM